MMKQAQLHIKGLHWPLLLVVALIAVLGSYNLHSSAAAHNVQLYLTQLGWFALGGVLIAFVLAVDYRMTETLAYIIYSLVCILLLLVLVSGKAAMGARRWLVLGPMTFQPSEIAKIAIIFCMARYFSHRILPGGYSMTQLLKPLNPSRPLACMVALAVFWHRPYVVDPVGELARGIHKQLAGTPPVLEDLLWFRAFLCVLWLFGFVFSLTWIVRAAKAASLLNPWPPPLRRRLLGLTVGLFIGLAALLAFAWHAPALVDPLGQVIGYLNKRAAPEGCYAVLKPGLTLRLLFVLLTGCYMTASLLHVRHSATLWIDVCIAPIDLLLVPALLVLVQPDLGTAVVILLIGITMIWVVGVRLKSLMIMGILAACIGEVAWFGILKDYQKRRILTFIDPEQDIRGAGWNAVQSLIAVGSGRWLGKGHLGGTQTQLSFLPEQHTDFAFSVWAEEQGFVGCSLLLALYLALLSFAFAIAAEARDTYGVLLATGVAALVLWQALINIGMVIGVLPVVGITLPLFSYGGSSVLTVLLCVGLLLNVHWRRRAY